MSMRNLCVRGVLAGLLLCVCAPAFALAPGLETAPSEAELPYSGFDWSYVGQYGGGSCVAIDDYWLLSVQHYSVSTSTNVQLGDGNTYTVAEFINAPVDPDTGKAPDLRLVRVNEKLPGYYDLYSGAPSSVVGEVAMLVGTGHTGTALAGGSRYTWDDDSARVLRWGTNRLDSSEDREELGYLSEVFVMEFSSSDTVYEVGLADHDSGSGLFVNISSDPTAPHWVLAGVGAYAYSAVPSAYDTNRAIALNDDYRNWIAETVPEPATMLLLGAGGAALLRRRRR